MRAGHRQGGGVGGSSSGVVCENHLIDSEFSEGMRTHAHTLFEYPLGKPLEAKLLKELSTMQYPTRANRAVQNEVPSNEHTTHNTRHSTLTPKGVKPSKLNMGITSYLNHVMCFSRPTGNYRPNVLLRTSIKNNTFNN